MEGREEERKGERRARSTFRSCLKSDFDPHPEEVAPSVSFGNKGLIHTLKETSYKDTTYTPVAVVV